MLDPHAALTNMTCVASVNNEGDGFNDVYVCTVWALTSVATGGSEWMARNLHAAQQSLEMHICAW